MDDWQTLSFNTELNKMIVQLSSIVGFDPDVIKRLVRDTTDEVVFKILVEFRRSLLESIEKFEMLKLEPNSEDLYRTCHKLTGSAELLGFVDLGRDLRTFKKQEPSKVNTAKDIGTLIEKCKFLYGQIPEPTILG